MRIFILNPHYIDYITLINNIQLYSKIWKIWPAGQGTHVKSWRIYPAGQKIHVTCYFLENPEDLAGQPGKTHVARF